MFGMNEEQIRGIVRQLLLIGGTLATTLGWATPDKVAGWTATALALVGPVFMISSVIMSLVSKTQANIISSAASQTDVNGVKLVNDVKLNPLAQGVNDLARATPANVNIAVPPGSRL